MREHNYCLTAVQRKMDRIRPPANIDMKVRDLSRTWKRWREELTLYIDLAMAKKEDQIKVKMFQYLVGTTGRELFKTLGLTNESKLVDVLEAFDAHCDPKKSETVERYRFSLEIKRVESP